MPRRVQTPEGAKFYGKPIGTIIGPDGTRVRQPRPVTEVRLRSIYAQIEDAKKVGNSSQIKFLEAKFRRDLQRFASDSTPQEVNSFMKSLTSKED